MTKQQSNTKSVAFGESTHVDASEMHSLSESQVESMWYNKDDMIRFQAETRTLLKRRHQFDATKDSWRGLESGLNKNLSQSRKSTVRAILELQQSNKEKGVLFPFDFGMATLAMELNRDAVNRAIMLAAKDMREARSIHFLDDTNSKGYFPATRPATGMVHPKRKPAAARTA